MIIGLVEGALFDRNDKFYVALEKFHITLKILSKLDNADAIPVLERIDGQVMSVQDSTHHIEDESIDAAIIKLSEFNQEIQTKAGNILEHLKPFKYVFKLD